MQQCQVNFHSIFASCFDPNEWCMNNGLYSGSLNPPPPSHESTALTTATRLVLLLLHVLRVFDVLHVLLVLN